MIKAIVFDFDGVIVDSEPLHYRTFLRVLQKFGIDFDYTHYLHHYAGFDDRDAFAAMLTQDPNPNLQQLDSTVIARLCEQKAQAFQSVVAQECNPIPGVISFIDHVGPQVPTAIASGATRQDIAPILERLGLTKQFHPIVTADDVGRSKPDPETYRLAIRGLARHRPDLAIAPADCVAIEDTPAGIEAAHGAGLNTLGLTTTYPAHMLQRADRVIQSMEGLRMAQLRLWFG